MPRLKCTYDQFLATIAAHGFVFDRQDGTSHKQYRGVVGGQVRYVPIASPRWSDDVPTGTLKAMIRQSGLDQSLFRK